MKSEIKVKHKMEQANYFKECPREECGVFGIYDNIEAAKLTYLGLYALQHRGQESAGIVSSNGENKFQIHKSMGLVADVFNRESLERLKGSNAIGHVRYSTTGSSILANSQPILVNCKRGNISIAHNGNLTNSQELKDELESRGAIFQSTIDSEILIHLIAHSASSDLLEALTTSLYRLKGAFSLVMLTEGKMIAARDPHGFRPLSIGKLGNSYIVASETCAFDIVDGQLIREIEPGEIIIIDKDGLHSHKPFADTDQSFCVFEYIYYSRPDSVLGGASVHSVRYKLGKILAELHPVEADAVISVPDSSNSAALGYAHGSGIAHEYGLIRSHYIGRTFIQPDQAIRDFGVKLKFNPIRDVLKGKRVVVVDDSIVRGTTCRKIVKMIRNAGAKEIHFRVSAPPWTHPCYFGIDTPEYDKLIAATHSVDEICKKIGADTLGFMTKEGLMRAVPNMGYCTACFSGDYSVHPPQDNNKLKLERM